LFRVDNGLVFFRLNISILDTNFKSKQKHEGHDVSV